MNKQEQERDLTDKNHFVRRISIPLGNLTPEQHERALTDVALDVRLAAIERVNLTTNSCKN